MNLDALNRFLAPIKRQIFLLVGKALLTAVNNEGKVGFHDSGDRANPQRLSVDWFGKLTDIERAQPYGFETYPVIETAKAVLVSPDGSRGNAFVIMVQDDEYRPTDLAESETCHYGPLDDPTATTPTYQRVLMKADGSIEIKAGETNVIQILKDGKIFIDGKGELDINIAGDCNIDVVGDTNLTSPTTNIVGDVNISGDLDVVGNQTNDGTLDVTGNISTEADVSADGDVTADAAATAITLLTHFHQGNLGFPVGAPIGSGGGSTPASPPSAGATGEITDGLGTKSTNHTHPINSGSSAPGPTGTAT